MKRFPAFFLPVCFFLLSGTAALSENFMFRHRAGDQYRALSIVDEEVIFTAAGHTTSFTTRILNKISFHVEKTEGDKALISGNFVVSERLASGTYQVEDEYPSLYWLDSYGKMEIAPEYVMPVVRDVPLFPRHDLKPGDTWTSPGEEVHYFPNPEFPLSVARFPVMVAYRYEGPEILDGIEYQIIYAGYSVYQRLKNDRTDGETIVSGFSRQKIFWNPKAGRHYRNEDTFEFRWELPGGMDVLFRGTAVGRIIEAELMDKAKVAEEIRNALDEIDDTEVSIDDRGVTITMQNIQFAPDSARLLDSEIIKISRIAEILKKYPGRDILVSGHTALAGTEEGRLQLSRERAQAVAKRLIAIGVRNETEIMIQGFGATKPAATNTTETGRKLNRRVEITLMEN